MSLWLLKTVIARSVEQLCGLNAIKDNVYWQVMIKLWYVYL